MPAAHRPSLPSDIEEITQNSDGENTVFHGSDPHTAGVLNATETRAPHEQDVEFTPQLDLASVHIIAPFSAENTSESAVEDRYSVDGHTIENAFDASIFYMLPDFERQSQPSSVFPSEHFGAGDDLFSAAHHINGPGDPSSGGQFHGISPWDPPAVNGAVDAPPNTAANEFNDSSESNSFFVSPHANSVNSNGDEICVRIMRMLSEQNVNFETFLTSMLAHGYVEQSRIRAVLFSGASITAHRRRRGTSHPDRECLHCGDKDTTQWRRHPESKAYLCNSCGQRAYRARRA
ncbi:hypothetical protein R3P38DRAFT_3170964 [Favolaschia claudopus]|uniref:GATA-type domain-containing protein n=1 Tax=Favolaschia claudopus TaxID=2862362 RepID=A0AAW0DPG6_9AGAR